MGSPHGGFGRYAAGPRRELGHEPDYRFTLANERTFLAWIRTSLALIGGGLVLFQVIETPVPGGRRILGGALVGLGTLLALRAYRRWVRNEEALRTDAPFPPTRLPLLLAAGVGLVAVISVVVLVAGAWT
ncbi:MAG: DUF202 domain-containing protein [Actinobacteria bacterium]|nr:DUF202 domain-containing protein [Actinomycetota bacterium]